MPQRHRVHREDIQTAGAYWSTQMATPSPSGANQRRSHHRVFAAGRGRGWGVCACESPTTQSAATVRSLFCFPC